MVSRVAMPKKMTVGCVWEVIPGEVPCDISDLLINISPLTFREDRVEFSCPTYVSGSSFRTVQLIMYFNEDGTVHDGTVVEPSNYTSTNFSAGGGSVSFLYTAIDEVRNEKRAVDFNGQVEFSTFGDLTLVGEVTIVETLNEDRCSVTLTNIVLN